MAFAGKPAPKTGWPVAQRRPATARPNPSVTPFPGKDLNPIEN